jgi:hypothetical protein
VLDHILTLLLGVCNDQSISQKGRGIGHRFRGKYIRSLGGDELSSSSRIGLMSITLYQFTLNCRKTWAIGGMGLDLAP